MRQPPPAPSGVAVAVTLRQLPADQAPAPPETAATAEVPDAAPRAPVTAAVTPPAVSPTPPSRTRTDEARFAPQATAKRPRPSAAKPESPQAPAATPDAATATPAGPSVMVYAVYDVVVGAGGVAESIVVAQSSGTSRYDEAGASMIRSTMTFDPPQSTRPSVTSVVVRFYPGRR